MYKAQVILERNCSSQEEAERWFHAMKNQHKHVQRNWLGRLYPVVVATRIGATDWETHDAEADDGSAAV